MFESSPDHKLEAMVRLLLQAVDERLDVVRQHQSVLEECQENAFDHIVHLTQRLDDATAEIEQLKVQLAAQHDRPVAAASRPSTPALELTVPFETWVDGHGVPEAGLDAASEHTADRPSALDAVLSSLPERRQGEAMQLKALPTDFSAPVHSSESLRESLSLEGFASQLDAKLAELLRAS